MFEFFGLVVVVVCQCFGCVLVFGECVGDFGFEFVMMGFIGVEFEEFLFDVFGVFEDFFCCIVVFMQQLFEDDKLVFDCIEFFGLGFDVVEL